MFQQRHPVDDHWQALLRWAEEILNRDVTHGDGFNNNHAMVVGVLALILRRTAVRTEASDLGEVSLSTAVAVQAERSLSLFVDIPAELRDAPELQALRRDPESIRSAFNAAQVALLRYVLGDGTHAPALLDELRRRREELRSTNAPPGVVTDDHVAALERMIRIVKNAITESENAASWVS